MDIRIENLQHTYRSQGIEARTVLSIPDWHIMAGTQTLLRGISGSGKTTLLNILAGLQPPTCGQIWFDNQAIYQLSEAKRDQLRAKHIGYVFQSHLLVPTLSALENVEMPLIFAGGIRPSQRRNRAAVLLDSVGLASFHQHRPVQLSVGQRLRVSIARALINRPALLLADEPTAALDQQAGQAVLDLMQKLSKEHHATVIVASHDPGLNSRFDQTVTLQDGSLRKDTLEGDMNGSLLSTEAPHAL